jgi:SAM-dependent methyltransferase
VKLPSDERPSPIPPLAMRILVGPTDERAFDNPSGRLVFPDVPPEAYESVFDFGCGCGRIARTLIQQRPQPRRYLGVDHHRGMIKWCRENLKPFATNFEFVHHDTWNLSFNPGARKPRILPFPADGRAFTLVIAWSVFTHVIESHAMHYLSEVSRILRPDGLFAGTWFLFDKYDFPMMQDFQNALFINDLDPTNAVIFDREWLRKATEAAGLRIVHVVPPEVRGFQWTVHMVPNTSPRLEVEFPADEAPYGIRRAGISSGDPAKVGLQARGAARWLRRWLGGGEEG